MHKNSIEIQLALAEQQLDAAVHCLNEGHGQALMEASEGLQTTAVGLVQLMHTARSGPNASHYGVKIGELAQRLISLRENLIRRSAYVERALKVVMPAVEKTTYQTRGPYGSTLRSAGAINTASA
jgi:hypothetical protein